MNSNRKRNLKKLARNIITATALYGTVSGPGIQATDATDKSGISGSSVLTGLSMLVGCGVIAGAGYVSNQRKAEADEAFHKQSLEFQRKQAEESIKDINNRKLLNENGIDPQHFPNIITSINTIKRDNKSHKYITADDFYACLKEGGALTKAVVAELERAHDNPRNMQTEIAEQVSKFFAVDDPSMAPLTEAVNVLMSGIKDLGNLNNCFMAVSAGAFAGNQNNWAWKNDTLRNKQVVANDLNQDAGCTGTKDFSFMQINYQAGDKLLPPALKKVLEDTLWCGIASAPPRANNEGEVAWAAAAEGLHDRLLASLRTNNACRASMEKGNLPLFLVISCKPYEREATGIMRANSFRLIPLFKNGKEQLGKKEDPNLKAKIGQFICSMSGMKPKSDKELGVEDFK